MAEKTFWEHLEEMRWLLLRCIAVVFAIAVAAFCMKDFVFNNIILAPRETDFVTYRALCWLARVTGISSLCPQIITGEMININLATQLFTHLSVSFYLAIVVALPYIITEVWLFVSPALYSKERRPAAWAVAAFFFQFFLGMALAYFLIFPLTYNFLSNYQVSSSVVNQISLNSYISTFIGLVFVMALVFEMPVVAYFFAKISMLNSEWLSRYRKIAIVATLILAAFITPSTDIFTMCLVALPLYLLYEFSRYVVKRVERKK